MVNLRDLFDQNELGLAMAGGYVRAQQHPDLPLTILNYQPKTMFDRAWGPVTCTCRGLIVDRHSMDVVARPFPKFFGIDDPLSGAVDLAEPVTVTDKVDGALGVLYPAGDGEWAVATRGSFTSRPALHATEVWQRRYADRWTPPSGMTALFEIVYPGWRIIIDYGHIDDLVLLGFVDIESGRTYSPTETYGWPGPVAEVMPYRSLPEALSAPMRDNAEGLVVHFLESDVRKKIKQSDYVALARLMMHCTARRLWTYMAVHANKDGITSLKDWEKRLRISADDAERALAAGPNWLDALIEGVPDEFYGWIRSRIDQINGDVGRLRAQVAAALVEFGDLYSGNRICLAGATRDHALRGAIMRAADGRIDQIEHWVWRAVRPQHETPFRVPDEDVA